MDEATLALLWTDVVDSTALNDRLGDEAMRALWIEHDQAARSLLTDWHGREIGRSDGFLLLFGHAGDAVGYALSYHRALAALSVPLRARVGIHLGPVRLRENPAPLVAQGATPFEVDGLALPAAARVMALAQGGQTLVTAPVVQALGAGAPRTVSHGHWRLKGLGEPMALYEVGEDGAPFAPPPDSEKAYRVVAGPDGWQPARELPHNLPAERDAFVDRVTGLQAVARWFDEGRRMVTLAGPGGVGKTRLALRYARRWLGDYSGGAWFCNLAAAQGLDGIVHAVAQALDVPLGRADPVQQLGAAIAGRGRCLLVLDNLEQVAPLAEAFVGVWIESAPQARFLATSRERLGIAGEAVQVLAPLAAGDAVSMFRERLRDAGASDRFGAEDEAALPALMDLLDHLPLAIELAAARGRLMGPVQLLQRVEQRFTVLAWRAGRPARQATLRATLDWSWDLLTVAERQALAQLSVFEGGFTLPAAEAVLRWPGPGAAPEAVDVVQALLEKSLLYPCAEGRLDLLRAVHDHAAERLRALAGADGSGVLAGVAGRHADHFAGLGGVPEPALREELDNLVAAVRRSVAGGRPAAAVGALEGAWRVLKLRGPFRAVGELAELVCAMPGLQAAQAARAQRVAGWGLRACGRAAEAERRLAGAVAGAAAAGDRACEALACCHLGDLLAGTARAGAARQAYDRALALALAMGDATLECEARNGLGNLHEAQGEAAAARTQYEGVLAAARRRGDRRWEGGALGNLGVLCANHGRAAEAEAFYLRSLEVARELGDRQWEGNTLCNLGLLRHEQGHPAAAAEALGAALQSARELGHGRLEAVVLCNLGIAAEALGELGRAAAHHEAALDAAGRLGDRRIQGQAAGYLALLRARAGRFDEARALLAQAHEHLSAVADRHSLALVCCAQAECELLAGLPAAADAALAAAAAIAHEVGAEAGSELQRVLERTRALRQAALTSPGS